MNQLRRNGLRALGSVLTALLLVAAALMPGAAGATSTADITLLFTTDIHSNAVPHLAMLDGEGARLGGFARLKTAVDAQYAEGRTLLLDSGDFSMGTLYQNFTQSDALELTLMDGIGYDAIALGNHDYELGEDGMRSEFAKLRENGGTVTLLASNLTGGSGQAPAARDDNPLVDLGVQNYTVFERNGVRIGVFALMGYDAISYTPTETWAFADPIETAKVMVDRLRNTEKVDLVVALAHVGTMPDGSFHEDADLAAAVDGIDVILSGHEHVPLPELIKVNDTMIVCAGTALNHLGKLELTRGANGWSGAYELIPLTDAVKEDPAIAKTLASYGERIDAEHLLPMGVTTPATADFAYTEYDFIDGDHMCLALKNYAFGALIGDAYFDALQKAGVANVAAVAIPVGFVRNGLYRGRLQTMDVYNALSYGISPIDGSSAAPICVFYLSGSELYNLCETSVSLSGLMNSVQMLLSGMRFSYTKDRLLLNRVYSVEIADGSEADGYAFVKRDDHTLYKVAASWTALQNLSLLGEKSYGLISIEPKDENGVPLAADMLQSTVVLRQNGMELKEWYALYDYIASMPVNDDGLHVIDARYGTEPAYMIEEEPPFQQLLVNPSKAFRLFSVVILLLVILLLVLVLLIVRSVKRKRQKKAA